MVRILFVAALACVSMAACSAARHQISISPEAPTTAARTTLAATWAAAEVFRRVDIPVADEDAGRGVVESGTFRVQRVWGGEPVSARLSCPGTDAQRIEGGAFDVNVSADVQSSGGATRNSVMVRGHARHAGEESIAPCSLTHEFRNWLTDEIRREAAGLPPRVRVGS